MKALMELWSRLKAQTLAHFDSLAQEVPAAVLRMADGTSVGAIPGPIARLVLVGVDAAHLDESGGHPALYLDPVGRLIRRTVRLEVSPEGDMYAEVSSFHLVSPDVLRTVDVGPFLRLVESASAAAALAVENSPRAIARA